MLPFIARSLCISYLYRLQIASTIWMLIQLSETFPTIKAELYHMQ